MLAFMECMLIKVKAGCKNLLEFEKKKCQKHSIQKDLYNFAPQHGE